MRHLLVSLALVALGGAEAWADHLVITYVRPDGAVSVVESAPECLRQLARPVGTASSPGECPALGITSEPLAVEWIRQRVVPSNARNVSIHERRLLPSRALRNQWKKAGDTVQ